MKNKKLIITIFVSFTWLSIFPQSSEFFNKLSDAAISITKQKVVYDPVYKKIGYPNGDIHPNKGVCTDVVIRAYRKLNIDLQKEVHEDMGSNFNKYPSKKMWGLNTTDTNIDHRRVPNLEVFFNRKGTIKPITKNPDDYIPGDIVTWRLDSGLAHIGIIINKKSRNQKNYLVVHNIGAGQVIEDCLFSWKIVGHYQYKK